MNFIILIYTLKKKLKLFRQLDQCTHAIMPKRKKNIPSDVLQHMTMDMINVLYKTGEFAKAKEGLQLMRPQYDVPRWHKMIDNMIECCDGQIKGK